MSKGLTGPTCPVYCTQLGSNSLINFGHFLDSLADKKDFGQADIHQELLLPPSPPPNMCSSSDFHIFPKHSGAYIKKTKQTKKKE